MCTRIHKGKTVGESHSTQYRLLSINRTDTYRAAFRLTQSDTCARKHQRQSMSTGQERQMSGRTFTTAPPRSNTGSKIDEHTRVSSKASQQGAVTGIKKRNVDIPETALGVPSRSHGTWHFCPSQVKPDHFTTRWKSCEQIATDWSSSHPKLTICNPFNFTRDELLHSHLLQLTSEQQMPSPFLSQ